MQTSESEMVFKRQSSDACIVRRCLVPNPLSVPKALGALLLMNVP